MADPILTRLVHHAIPVSWRTTWDLVELGAEEGAEGGEGGEELTGYGELSDSHDRPAAMRALAEWERMLVGRGVDAGLELLAHAAAGIAAEDEDARRVPLAVIGGLETALCDLAARRARTTVAEWVGAPGPPGPVQVYANINRAARDRTTEVFARLARSAVADGFTAVKIAPFDGLAGRPDRAEYGLAIARATRDAIGPDVDLMVDCHRHLPVAQTLAIAPGLAALELRWLEDACHLDDLDGWRRIRDAVGAPMAGGEQAAGIPELLPALEAGLLQVVLPDVKYTGGVRRARAMADGCAAHGAEVALHNPSGPVATAASLHAQAGIGTARILEYAYGETADRAALLDPPERIESGVLHPAPGPGLGLELAPRPPAS